MELSPLLNRPRPYPDEALISWLWRLAGDNHLDSPSLLLRHIRETVCQTTPVMRQVMYGMREAAVLTALGEMTTTTAKTVYQHTLHRFAHVLTPPDQEVSPLQLSPDTILKLLPARLNRDLYTAHFGWCPVCLAEARYVRLHWHIPLVVCCEVHHCWLLDLCPVCQRPLNEADILTGHCAHCSFPLEQAATVPIAAEDLLMTLQSTLMSWLYGGALPPVELPNVPMAALLRVLHGLRYTAQRAGTTWDFYHIPSGIPVPDLDILKQRQLTLVERGCLYATAFRGLLDWPQGFFAFLDAYRQRPAERTLNGLQDAFGNLYRSWLMRFWQHPAFDFIQTAFNDYLVERMPVFHIIYTKRAQDYPELRERVAYLDMYSVVKMLNTSPTTLFRLADEGYLTLHRFADDDGIWLARSEVDQLRQRWRGGLLLKEVVQMLGLSKQRVREMLEANLLQEVFGSVGLHRLGTSIDQDSLNTFIQGLQDVTTIQTDTTQTGISLVEVCLRHATLGVNLVQLLQCILEGKLSAYHPHESLLPLSALWFLPDDVADLFNLIKQENDWLTLRETQTYLGIGRQVLQYLVDAGVLCPDRVFGHKQFFRQTEVQALRDRYMTTSQAMELLAVSRNDIHAFVHHKLLTPLSGPGINGHGVYVFDRDDLKTWHDRYILYRELRTLTIRLGALLTLLQSRHIEPLMHRPRVYFREPVLAVLEQMEMNSSIN